MADTAHLETQLERVGLRDGRTRVARLVEVRVTAYTDGLRNGLGAPMKHAVVGGKMLRGFFVCETARLHGIGYGQAVPAAVAIECIHAYSLVHDDLPCMDDDDLRRGSPTVHVKWDEATAVLVGDALQAFAFEEVVRFDGSAEARLALSQSLAQAAGAEGMVGGQVLDIAAETAAVPLTLDQITELQAGKTGALLTWSCMAGARMAGADVAPFQTYGDKIGLAFQIADDVLDVVGDAAEVGKATQKDADAGKATFVSLLGLAEAKRRAQALVDDACDALAPFGADANTLREAAQFVVSRSN
ncbi:polyprenyl synthetase family protein [Cognatiyoonia sp.]|uniref:polyprenyl synthetase family protein n=1 Tax=Cognatiyoonia sp. TaxID=2211652 RepID=UPI003F6A264B